MKRKFLIVVLASMLTLSLSTGLLTAECQKKSSSFVVPPKTIINKDVPPIPTDIKKKVQQYTNIKSAYFSDWDPRGNGMIISSRLGDTTQIYRVDRPLAKYKQLTKFDEPVRGAVFSPDKNRNYLIFTKDVGGAENYQLFRYDLETGKSNLISDGKHRYTSPRFNKKGDMITYVSNKRTGKLFDIYIMDPQKPETEKLVYKSKSTGRFSAQAWFEDGKHLLCTHYISANKVESYILDIETGKTKNLTPKADKPLYFLMSFVSPDGKTVYGTTDLNNEFKRVVAVDVKTGKINFITKNMPWDAYINDVTEDFSKAVLTVNEGGYANVYLLDIKTLKYRPLNEIPKGIVRGLEFDKKGKSLAFSFTNARTNGDVFHYDLESGKTVRWTKSSTGKLDISKFREPNFIHFPTFDKVNGKPRMIPCFYYKPENKSGKPMPVVIDIHGGPEGQYRPSFRAFNAFLINELGIAVLAPNVRGSAGYGKTYLLLDNAEKRENSVRDIGSLLDWIAKRPELDKDRVAVVGGSYGGYMVLSSMFNYNDRLACGVDRVGISNFVTFLKNTSAYRRDLRRVEYGDERKIGEFLNSISPTTNAHKIKKPLFVIQGKNDPRVPATEAAQIVKTVSQNNVPVWYQLATNEGHGFSKKYNRDFMYYSVAKFLQEHLLKK